MRPAVVCSAWRACPLAFSANATADMLVFTAFPGAEDKEGQERDRQNRGCKSVFFGDAKEA